MTNKNVLLLNCDDWEALYVDGKCVAQCHTIQSMELLRLAKEHNFSFDNVRDHCASSKDDERAFASGEFPEFECSLEGEYL